MAAITKNISKTIITRHYGGICFGNVVYEPRGQYGPLIQQDYQLVLLIDGGLDLRVSDKWLRIPAGHVVLLSPGQSLLLLFEREQATRHQWCTAPESTLSTALKKRLGRQNTILPIPEMLHTIMRAGLQNEGSSSALHQPLHQSLAESAFLTFWMSRKAGEKNQSSAAESIRRVQRFIHEHYAEALSLTHLARQGGISPNHLIRLFREQMAETPMDYLWRIRVEQGATWLRETGLGISEIAYRAGFQNAFHFSRRFKQRYGKSPRAFRQKL
jgi:AraC family transcriptional regulator of arabinose operon